MRSLSNQTTTFGTFNLSYTRLLESPAKPWPVLAYPLQAVTNSMLMGIYSNV